MSWSISQRFTWGCIRPMHHLQDVGGACCCVNVHCSEAHSTSDWICESQMKNTTVRSLTFSTPNPFNHPSAAAYFLPRQANAAVSHTEALPVFSASSAPSSPNRRLHKTTSKQKITNMFTRFPAISWKDNKAQSLQFNLVHQAQKTRHVHYCHETTKMLGPLSSPFIVSALMLWF